MYYGYVENVAKTPVSASKLASLAVGRNSFLSSLHRENCANETFSTVPAYQQFLESNRKIRSKLLNPVGRFILRLKLTANHLTFFSFLLGLVAVYFLFQNHLLFIVFAFLHLITDSLDGVLARLTKPTLFGRYLDYFSDRTISLLILIKLYFYLQDYYVALVILLFIASQIIYVFSKFKYPVYFIRTGSVIVLSFYPLFPQTFLTIGYLVAGTFCVYSLLLQLKHFLRTKTYPS